jgi:hypothetical protein
MAVKRFLAVLPPLLAGLLLGGCPFFQAQEIIIDNTDPQASILAGDWQAVGDSQAYGGDFLYLFADHENVGTVRFTPDIASPGWYTVYITWAPGDDRTTDQPVLVHDADGDTTYHVNLQTRAEQWVELGRHWFTLGTSGYIEFTNDTDDGFCNADAVRLVPGS